MTEIDFKKLGFTCSEIRARVIDRISKQIMTKENLYDPDSGEHYYSDSDFERQLHKFIKEQISITIQQIAEESVLPNVDEYIKNLTIEKTNTFGEKKGESFTFIEYLVSCAQNYMTAKVDYNGKSQPQSYSSSWKGTQTRLTYLIEKHLHYSISSAMEGALKDANSYIAEGLEKAVKVKLQEVQNRIKVAVSTK